MNTTYLNNIRALLDRVESTQTDVIDAVSKVCANAIYNKKLLYFFGTGHSHMVCEEPFYRAGGLASISPVLVPMLMLHESASKSSNYERIDNLGTSVIEQSGITEGDVLFLISNSGRNSAIIDAAEEGKRLGAITIAITSLQHSESVESRHKGGKRLFELCDYVLDNCGEPGDASVSLQGLSQKIGPTSSAVDITMVNLVIVNTTERLLKMGMIPPVFTSANMDNGDDENRSIINDFKPRISIL